MPAERLLYIKCIYVCMANRLITLRLGNKLLKEIDTRLENSSFENRTEFIRHAVRSLLKEMDSSSLEETEERAVEKTAKGKKSGFAEEIIEELRYVR